MGPGWTLFVEILGTAAWLVSSRLRLLAVFSLAAFTISSTSFDGRGFCFGVVFFGIPKFPTC